MVGRLSQAAFNLSAYHADFYGGLVLFGVFGQRV
jgi:hypothetical protein